MKRMMTGLVCAAAVACGGLALAESTGWHYRGVVSREPALELPRPIRVGPGAAWIVGDSLSIALADPLESLLKQSGSGEIVKLGKVSSGLCRPDFFDWNAALSALAAKSTPARAHIMLGANDDKPMRLADGRTAAFMTPLWKREYQARMEALFAIIRRASPRADIAWVSVPVMADARFDADMLRLNGHITAVCRENGVRFLDVRPALADESGRFTLEKTAAGRIVKIRTPDGVHITPAGGRLLAQAAFRGEPISAGAPEPDKHAIKPRFEEFPRLATALPAPVPASIPASVSGAATPPAKSHETASKAEAPRSVPAPPPIPSSKPVPAAKALSEAAGGFALQDSSWKHVDQAARRVRELTNKGVPARIVEVDLGDKGLWRRVMIGGFDSAEAAERGRSEFGARVDLSRALVSRAR